MKCDELKAYGMNDPAIGDEYEMYKVSDVDAAIEELKAMVTTDNSSVIDRLEDDLRKLKRALWLARANHCKWAALYFWYGYTDKHKSIRYEKAEAKCFNKAKEYE